jgi:hypothetical protein
VNYPGAIPDFDVEDVKLELVSREKAFAKYG